MKENGKFIENLYFYDEGAMPGMTLLRQNVRCSSWLRRDCPKCGQTWHQYIEIGTVKMFICPCGRAINARKRP